MAVDKQKIIDTFNEIPISQLQNIINENDVWDAVEFIVY